MTNEKLEVHARELGNIHSTIEKLVAALVSTMRRCEQEENDASPSERKVGKLRMEICASEHKLTDLQKFRCERAQEGLALRYLELKQRLEEELANREAMALQESSISSQLVAIQEKITAFDCDPSWQLSRLTQQTKRIVVGPLRRALDIKLDAMQQAHRAAVNQAAELESQLNTIKGELSESGTREAVLKGELKKLLAEGETEHRVIRGGPQQLRAALKADPGLTVDRWQAEQLLQQWEKGFVEVLDRGLHLEAPQVVNFAVEDAAIAFWFDTGEVAGSEILWAAAGDTIWSKSHRGLPLNLMAETLEAKRAAAEAQPVGV